MLQIEQLILVLNAMGDNGYCVFDLSDYMDQVFPERIAELKQASTKLMSPKVKDSVKNIMRAKEIYA